MSPLFVMDRAAYNQGRNAKYDIHVSEGGGSTYISGPWAECYSKVGALCATDYKWVQQQQVTEGKLVVSEN